jgi:hypothetical protein
MRMGENYRKEPKAQPDERRIRRPGASRKQHVADGGTSSVNEHNPPKPNVGRPTPWKDASLRN